MNKNMTALISCFARYYHTKNSSIKIYNDIYAKNILTEKEIKNISNNMKAGINYFNPNYKENDPLTWIVNNNLAPSVLARSIFNEKHLQEEINTGLKQYIILASGYDTSAYKLNNKIKVFELDKKEMIEDKKKRIKKAKINNSNVIYIATNFNKNWINDLLNNGFNPKEKSFCSMLGISYYLEKETFKKTIKKLSNIIPKGSVIIFDYPNDLETNKEKINKELAKSAKEEMKGKYSYLDIKDISEESNMLIHKHLDYNDINNTYFYKYNKLNTNDKIIASMGINYVMLIKK